MMETFLDVLNVSMSKPVKNTYLYRANILH